MRQFLTATMLGLLATAATLASSGVADAQVGNRDCAARKTVRFGETAADIARRCGVTPESLIRNNPGLNNGDFRNGSTLNVPAPPLLTPRMRIGGSVSTGGASPVIRDFRGQ